MTTWFRNLLLIVTLAAAAGCSLLPEEVDKTKDWSVRKLYSEAKASLDEGDYEQAVKYYELLQARFPFGVYAQQSQVELIYAYYKDGEPELAVAEADRFIKMHPRHPHVDYVYYMKGLVNFNRNYGLIERYLPMDSSQRDQAAARQSFFDFQTLVKQFPSSKYAEDARQRMIFLRNSVARYEVHVARYYLRRGAYVAAANRAKYVIENYQGADAMPEALTALVIAYRLMELPELAEDAMRVLKLNYPDSPGIAEAEAAQPGERYQTTEDHPWWQL
ncbi:outer membrane protein assembly factor BamD [Endothiovibrio diazotrophicus]